MALLLFVKSAGEFGQLFEQALHVEAACVVAVDEVAQPLQEVDAGRIAVREHARPLFGLATQDLGRRLLFAAREQFGQSLEIERRKVEQPLHVLAGGNRRANGGAEIASSIRRSISATAARTFFVGSFRVIVRIISATT